MGRPAPPPNTSTPSVPPQAPRKTVASYTYLCILYLFRFVLRVFYSNVVVEGSDNILPDGVPCILCSNHTNSLTDALLLVATVPRNKRALLRLTAKDTQFGRGTFTSWLIESAGTVPIMRPKDHLGVKVDNSVVFKGLIKVLEDGDMVCMFPEGLSRYYPEMASLKQGVARLVSDVLARHEHDPDFKLAIQTCSITYLHRNLFRSDVLVTYHPPTILTPLTHPLLIAADDPSIRSLTNTISTSIRSGTLDSPSWSYIRLSHTARRLYAPHGTGLGLGDHVRLTQRFVDVFAKGKESARWVEGMDPRASLKGEMREKGEGGTKGEDLVILAGDLKTYQDLLHRYGIKDDRVRNPRMLRRRTLFKRLFVRLAGAGALLFISIPGLCLWAPIFIVAKVASERQKKTGPVFDTWDEVAQTKLVFGLITGLAIYGLSLLLTLPIILITLPSIPLLMWLTLRWLEDFTSSLRAALALVRLLSLGKGELGSLQRMREGLRVRVVEVAVRDAGLPEDSQVYLKGGSRWARYAGFFSLQRRRKKDWNEVLRLWDFTEFPEGADELPVDVGAAASVVPSVAPKLVLDVL